MMLAESLADAGSESAAAYAEQLRPFAPADADFVLARLRYRQQRIPECASALRRALLTMRRNPWETVDALGRTLDVARNLTRDRRLVPAIIDALSQPYAAGQWEDIRRWYLAIILRESEACTPRTIRAIRAMEPWPPWQKDFLTMRRDCYATVMLGDLKRRADDDLEVFTSAEPAALLK